MMFQVAVGADEPLAEHMMVADFFRKDFFLTLQFPVDSQFVDGIDGLGGIHHSVRPQIVVGTSMD